MGRIRTVKPELFKHEGLFEAEQRYQLPLRLVYIGLFTCCDREGRFRWQPRRLKLDILPYDNVEMPTVLDALAESGFVVAYEVQGIVYGYIPSWSKHQCINNKESKSQIPDIKQGLVLKTPLDSTNTNYFLDVNSLNVHDLNAQTMAASPVALANPTAGLLDHVAASISRKYINSHKKMIINDGIVNVSLQEEQRLLFESKITDRQFINACKNRELLQPPLAPPTCEPPEDHATLFALNQHEGKGKGKEYGRECGKELELEREKEGCGKEKPKHDKSSSEAPLKIFAYWQRIMNHPKAVLDKSRQKSIHNALAMGYDMTALCQAIRGCACTPHNMGQNDRGERYDGLHVIFKSADQIDRFIRNATNPPRPLGKSEQRLQSNIAAAEQWLSQSNSTEEVNHGSQR